VKLLVAHIAATHTAPAPYLRQAPEPSQLPSVPHVATPWSAHWFSGSWPAGTTLHVPRLPACAHDWQVPPHAVAQHTPCAHTFDAQSTSAAHVAPFDFLPHTPPLQVFGLTHCVFDVHVARQAAAPHWNGVHEDCVPAAHVPVPLHWGADVNVEPAHVAAPQVVPAAYRRQAPAPSHVPSSPQFMAPPSVHWFSGSWPAATSEQVPRLPASAHERQVPVHELEQQTPCWQKLEPHSAPAAHAAPSSFFEQTPLLQTYPAAQSAAAVHVVRHVLFVSQVYVPHEDCVPGWHVPVPLHVRACVYVPAAHVAAAHDVPAAYFSHVPAPSHAPFIPQLAAPWSAHWFSGSCPCGTGEHVPSLPGTAHDWHVPVHAAPQQMPCSQKPDMQSVVAVQVPPAGFFPQLPLRHRFPPEQSAFVVQVLRQVASVLHWNGVQARIVPGTQTPAPSQVGLGVNVAPVHAPAPHTVPLAYRRQAPAPLHAPSVPHVIAPWSAHWFSGSWPAGTFVHTPSDPARLQAWQGPAQALSQHTPCWHAPVAHSAPLAQAAPPLFFLHAPPMQL
jgi:hypothetical protein